MTRQQAQEIVTILNTDLPESMSVDVDELEMGMIVFHEDTSVDTDEPALLFIAIDGDWDEEAA